MVERIAIENGTLDPNSDDPRLFLRGPADPFKTRMQQDLAMEMASSPTIQLVGLQPEADIQQESQPVLAISVDMDM